MTTKNKKIILMDNQRKHIKDKCVETSDKSRMKGWVEIYDKNNGQLLSKSNLIVYSGREIALQRILNKDRVDGSLQKDLFVTWLSVGTGGATPGDILNPVPPNPTDTALTNEVVLNVADPTFADNFKKHPINSIVYEQDPENENKFLIGKLTTTIGSNDANGYDINEAALWLSETDDPTTAATFILWAKVTFSTIRKSSERELSFVWYLFF